MEGLTANTTTAGSSSAFDEALNASCAHFTDHKIEIRFKAIGRAPILKHQVYKISSSQTFGAVEAFLRAKLGFKDDAALVRSTHLAPLLPTFPHQEGEPGKAKS